MHCIVIQRLSLTFSQPADLGAAYANTLAVYLGSGSVMVDKPSAALLLDGAGRLMCLGTEALAKSRSLPSPPKDSSIFHFPLLGLAVENRDPVVGWTVDSLSQRLVDADVTFPRGSIPAKACLIDLIILCLKAACDRIDRILLEARRDKAVHGGGPFVVHYVLTYPACWDRLARGVVLRAALRGGA